MFIIIIIIIIIHYQLCKSINSLHWLTSNDLSSSSQILFMQRNFDSPFKWARVQKWGLKIKCTSIHYHTLLLDSCKDIIYFYQQLMPTTTVYLHVPKLVSNWEHRREVIIRVDHHILELWSNYQCWLTLNPSLWISITLILSSIDRLPWPFYWCPFCALHQIHIQY